MDTWNCNDRTFWHDGDFLQGWNAQKPAPDTERHAQRFLIDRNTIGHGRVHPSKHQRRRAP